MPHKEAGHMKASDQTRPDNNAFAKGASTYESQISRHGNPLPIHLGRKPL
jgi:hypothetical protein